MAETKTPKNNFPGIKYSSLALYHTEGISSNLSGGAPKTDLPTLTGGGIDDETLKRRGIEKGITRIARTPHYAKFLPQIF
jgi:hypothetical protein